MIFFFIRLECDLILCLLRNRRGWLHGNCHPVPSEERYHIVPLKYSHILREGKRKANDIKTIFRDLYLDLVVKNMQNKQCNSYFLKWNSFFTQVKISIYGGKWEPEVNNDKEPSYRFNMVCSYPFSRSTRSCRLIHMKFSVFDMQCFRGISFQNTCELNCHFSCACMVIGIFSSEGWKRSLVFSSCPGFILLHTVIRSLISVSF